VTKVSQNINPNPSAKEYDMLVLSRRLGEEIIIGENIRLTILAIRGNHVRLGFAAPPDVPIRRRELPPLPRAGAARATSVAGAAPPAIAAVDCRSA
jgi:carbon storage regulator